MLVIKNTPTANALRASQSMAQSLTGIAEILHRRGAYGADVSNIFHDKEKAEKLEKMRLDQEKNQAELEDAGPMARATAAAMSEMERSQGGFGTKAGQRMEEEFQKDYDPKDPTYWAGGRADTAMADMITEQQKQTSLMSPEKRDERVVTGNRPTERYGKEKTVAMEEAHKQIDYGTGLNEEAKTGYGPDARDRQKEMEDRYPTPELSAKDSGFAKQYNQLQDRYKKLEETGELQEKAKNFSKETKRLSQYAEKNPERIPGNTREEQYTYVYDKFDKAMREAKTTTEKMEVWNKSYANMKNLDRYWEKNDADSFFSGAKLKLYLGGKKTGGARPRKTKNFSVSGQHGDEIKGYSIKLDPNVNGGKLADNVKKALPKEKWNDNEAVAKALEKQGWSGEQLAAYVREGHFNLENLYNLKETDPGEGEYQVMQKNKALREGFSEAQTARDKAKVIKDNNLSLKSYLRANPDEIWEFRAEKAVDITTAREAYVLSKNPKTKEEIKALIREFDAIANVGKVPSFGARDE